MSGTVTLVRNPWRQQGEVGACVVRHPTVETAIAISLNAHAVNLLSKYLCFYP